MDVNITGITQDFYDGMVKSGNNARIQIVALIRQMETDANGQLLPSDRNYQLIDGVGIGIQQVALSGAFQQRVNKVINSVPAIRKETERRFILKHGIIPSETLPILDDLEIQITSYLEEALGATAIENEVLTPVQLIMQQMLVSDMTKNQAITLATEKVPSLFTEYARTRVDTTLQIYVREQTRILSEAKELVWFFYAGPVTNPTPLGNPRRPWCMERVRGTYLKQEIETWADEDWEGKIPDTNQYSIFTNAGGYNCHHSFIPVDSKDVPQSDITRARNKGLI